MSCQKDNSIMETEIHLSYDGHQVEMQSMDSLASSYSRKKEGRRKRIWDVVIHHEGKFKIIWDWIVLILVIFTAIQIPYYSAFHERQKTLLTDKVEVILIITGLVDCMFILDIFINFRTTYRRSSTDKHEKNPRKLAIHYFKTWFIIDLLAAIPFDWIIHQTGNTSTLIGLLKSARLLRLFRVARRLDRYSEYGVAVLFLLMCLFVLCAHWLACIWNYIAREEKRNPNSWVRRMDAELYPTLRNVCNCTNEFLSNATTTDAIRMTHGQRYIASLYFVVSSLTSVGFGNIAASTEIEQAFSVLVMLIGALMYASIFGNMVAIVQRLYSKASTFHTNISIVREFMKFYKIPEPLQSSVNNYIRRDWKTSQELQTDLILQRFPDCIQADLTYELYQRVFHGVKPLRDATVSCMRALSMKFKTITLQENNILLRQGEEINRFYIVGQGALEVIYRGALVKVLTKHATFGFDTEKSDERNKSKANVRADQLVQIHYIDKNHLLEIMKVYPKFTTTFKRNCLHSFDLNDPEEEGYFSAPPKIDKSHIGAVARQALGIPFMTRFNSVLSFRRKNLQVSEAKSENCLYDFDSVITANGNREFRRPKSLSESETQSQKSEPRSTLDVNSCENLKPIIKTHSKLFLDTFKSSYSDTGSLNSVRFKTRDASEMDVIHQRMTILEEKVEKMNNTLEEKCYLILQTLNEIKNRNHDNSRQSYDGGDRNRRNSRDSHGAENSMENEEVPPLEEFTNTADVGDDNLNNNNNYDVETEESIPILNKNTIL